MRASRALLVCGDLQLPVDFTMRLRGFDRRPVTQRMVWTFVRNGNDVLLANDRHLQMDAKTGWTPAPWDLAHIDVRRSGGILAIFDEDTSQHADYVMADLAAASEMVGGHLPAWSRIRPAWPSPCWHAQAGRWRPTGSW